MDKFPTGKIALVSKQTVERIAGKNAIGTTYRGSIVVADTHKTPLTVAHELYHYAAGEAVQDVINSQNNLPPTGNVPKDILDLIKRVASGSSKNAQDYEARKVERKVANELVENCNYFIESYDYVYNDGANDPVIGIDPKKLPDPKKPVLDEPLQKEK